MIKTKHKLFSKSKLTALMAVVLQRHLEENAVKR